MLTPISRIAFKEFNEICVPLARFRHFMRGKPPGIAKSLAERLEEENKKDPDISYRVNIGYSQTVTPVKLKDRLEHYKKKSRDEELEKLSRQRQLKLSVEDVRKEWNQSVGPNQIRIIADHYGIYEHLFGDAYFIPIVPLDVKFKSDNSYIPVYRGNIIKPFEASQCPEVKFDAESDSLWTLILTNPDGNFTDSNAEYVHWFVGNIPGSDLSKGDLIYDYLQPFPPHGVGFQRFVFILYKQEGKIDYDSYNKKIPCRLLAERNFKTKDFYRKHQDVLTPAGLAFFQSDWDPSLTDFFHNVLEMKEPTYEYDFPKPYIKPQVWYPIRQPFNLYLDKYRDEKEIAKEFLLKKLKKEHPFKAPEKKPKYPNAFPIDKKYPSWLRLEMKKERLGWGRVNDY
ncbi:hypothetical protein J437_LFUL012432 [Ladona fulva]|uniref:Large ribosomal subunit protein mL38 n=1 Tax=Ladona fulva TaxID=123851 RepID=A0A8K0P4W6_LADFU|nr:hypothetical protein J437_LFUL012432 [Ladona fulva]